MTEEMRVAKNKRRRVAYLAKQSEHNSQQRLHPAVKLPVQRAHIITQDDITFQLLQQSNRNLLGLKTQGSSKGC